MKRSISLSAILFAAQVGVVVKVSAETTGQQIGNHLAKADQINERALSTINTVRRVGRWHLLAADRMTEKAKTLKAQLGEGTSIGKIGKTPSKTQFGSTPADIYKPIRATASRRMEYAIEKLKASAAQYRDTGSWLEEGAEAFMRAYHVARKVYDPIAEGTPLDTFWEAVVDTEGVAIPGSDFYGKKSYFVRIPGSDAVEVQRDEVSVIPQANGTLVTELRIQLETDVVKQFEASTTEPKLFGFSLSVPNDLREIEFRRLGQPDPSRTDLPVVIRETIPKSAASHLPVVESVPAVGATPTQPTTTKATPAQTATSDASNTKTAYKKDLLGPQVRQTETFTVGWPNIGVIRRGLKNQAQIYGLDITISESWHWGVKQLLVTVSGPESLVASFWHQARTWET